MVILMGSHRVLERPKDKYLDTIETHYMRILEIYLCYEEKQPVMLFDVTEGKLYAYPYKEFKKELNVCGRELLTKQYNEAHRGNQFVIFMRDSQKKKLMSYSLARPSAEQSNRFKSIEELNELELAATDAPHRVGGGAQQPYRIRRPGGGRKLTEEKDPTIVTALEQMLKDEVGGDPMTEQK
jgi:hypothetical protein